VAGTATVAVALAGSLSMSTAGASIGISGTTTALQAPARPMATSVPSDDAVDPFTDITAATESLTLAVEQASTATHQKIRADEVEQERKQAAERAAREAEERARLAAMYTKPLDGYQVSAQYGVRGWMWARGYHTGLDLTASYGSPVKAVHSGTVTYAGWDGAYGNKIEITHSDGTQTWYAHMSGLAVSGGQVTTGQVIGYVGSTGNSYGNHLHLEAHAPGGGELNPYTWLQSKGVTL
jgi:murein DD-endopeptidase MepM/ murein hydrolase activator NlpD